MAPSATIGILDYGMGNLRSVEKALERSGAQGLVSRDFGELRGADGLILPGVGAFPKAMRSVRELGLGDLVAERLGAGVPLLGICLGLQLLFEGSSEHEGETGLGLLRGRVEPLDAPGLKVPNIGWSPVAWQQDSALTEGIADGAPFYFVHSYTPVGVAAGDVLGTADYGAPFTCAVEHAHMFGVQFHPEKSSAAGLRLLQNFAGICARASAGRVAGAAA